MKEDTIYITKDKEYITAKLLSKGEKWIRTMAKEGHNSEIPLEKALINAGRARLNFDHLGTSWNKENNIDYPIVYE